MVLKRVLGAKEAAWLVAGNMIGAGIFITPGLVAGHLPGMASPLVAWLLGGVLALCGAAIYGELGSRLPQAGGDYQYLHRTFGPLWGFLTGWAAMLLSFSGAAAVMAMVAVDHLATVWAGASPVPSFVRPLLAPLVVLLLTYANVAGARFAGRTTAWLTALPVLGLALLFVLGWILGEVSPAVGSAGVPPAAQEAGTASAGRLDARFFAALGAAMIPVFFTYSGWNAAAYVAGEIHQPSRNLWRGLLFGTVGVTLFYVAFNAMLLVMLPQKDMAGSTTAAATAARQLLGATGEKSLALFVALAVLGSANVTLMAGARIYYAMALDGLAPQALGRANAAGVPSTALWASGIWTALLAMTGRIEALVNWATLAILLLSSLAVISLFWMRRHGIAPEAQQQSGESSAGSEPYRCPGYPVTPIVYLLASLAVAYASVLYDWKQALYGVLIVTAGVPVYGLARAWRRFKG